MNLLVRIASVLVLLPIVLGAIHFGGIPFYAVLTIALAIALHEGLSLVLPDLHERRLQAVILGSTLGGACSTYSNGIDARRCWARLTPTRRHAECR